MKELRILAEVTATAGCARSDVENWRRHKIIKYQPGAYPGSSGRYDHRAALEIAFTAALVSVGVKPSIAGTRARQWINDRAKGRLAPLYARNGRTGEELSFSNRNFDIDDLTAGLSDEIEGGWATEGQSKIPGIEKNPAIRVISVIDREAIIADVDALFAKRPRGTK